MHASAHAVYNPCIIVAARQGYVMPQTNRNEQQFLDALKAVFIGAKVEGDSGYINLMKIKASYFEDGTSSRC